MNRSTWIAVLSVLTAVAALVFTPAKEVWSQGSGPYMTIGAAGSGTSTTAWFMELSGRIVVACTSEGSKTPPVCRVTKF
jgi:hypothetical protein